MGTSAGGIEIASVKIGSKAAAVGLRKGDIVMSVNQQKVVGLQKFGARVKESPKRLLLNLVREGQALFILLE